MCSGWPNEKLEELIKGTRAFTDTNDPEGWFADTVSQIIRLPDHLAVEVTRICLMNLAIRYSGGNLDFANSGVSYEGLEHSVYRVLDLLREGVSNNGD